MQLFSSGTTILSIFAHKKHSQQYAGILYSPFFSSIAHWLKIMANLIFCSIKMAVYNDFGSYQRNTTTSFGSFILVKNILSTIVVKCNSMQFFVIGRSFLFGNLFCVVFPFYNRERERSYLPTFYFWQVGSQVALLLLMETN